MIEKYGLFEHVSIDTKPSARFPGADRQKACRTVGESRYFGDRVSAHIRKRLKDLEKLMARGLLLTEGDAPMLRITMHDDPEALTFQVEGRLVGAWAKEMEQSWKSAAPVRGNRTSVIDLTGILFIDDEGKRVLTELFREGASFRTAGPMTESVVAEFTGTAEITGKSSGVRRGP